MVLVGEWRVRVLLSKSGEWGKIGRDFSLCFAKACERDMDAENKNEQEKQEFVRMRNMHNNFMNYSHATRY